MRIAAAVILLTMSGLARLVAMQAPAPGAPPAPVVSAQAAAPIDLTGHWVSIVNEDWRWRMVTPPKGDYASLPLNPEGRKIADSWTPALDGRCEAYGAAALMRLPTRVRIGWRDDSTLTLETDAGAQTRVLRFASPASTTRDANERSLQGQSSATWTFAGRGGGFGGFGFGPPGGPPAGGRGGPRFGSLRVVT